MFWMKIFKHVRLRAIFHSSIKFESLILDESDFEHTSFTTDQISKWIWFVKKNRFWWMFCLHKIFFGTFYHAKPQLLQLSVFSKTMIWRKNGWKAVFDRKKLKRIRFWNKFLQRVRLWTKNFRICQIFSQL